MAAFLVVMLPVSPSNAEWEYGLWDAVKNGSPLKIREALNEGANVNARNEHGVTPLISAASNVENATIITTLVDAGAHVDARARWGHTALSVAAGSNPNPVVVQRLVKAGADIHARTDNGQTPLMVAAMSNSNPSVILALVRAGARLQARMPDGDTALHLAASNNVPAVVKTLADEGAAVDAVNDDGFTPLMLAAGNSSHPEVVKALVHAGADINTARNDGFTPLMAAAGNNGPAMLQTLLDLGADPSRTTNAGKYAADFATLNESVADADIYWRLHEGQYSTAKSASEPSKSARDDSQGQTGQGAPPDSTDDSRVGKWPWGWLALTGVLITTMIVVVLLLGRRRNSFRTSIAGGSDAAPPHSEPDESSIDHEISDTGSPVRQSPRRFTNMT